MREHRRAVAFLSAQQVERVLSLPEGVRVVAIRDDFLRNGVLVLVQGGNLAPVPEDVTPPEMPARLADAGTGIASSATAYGSCLEITCTYLRCPWSRQWREPVSLAVLNDAVRRHVAEAHAS